MQLAMNRIGEKPRTLTALRNACGKRNVGTFARVEQRINGIGLANDERIPVIISWLA